ncbi:MAG: DUF1549 and DUF1553 domain-containing protein [Planctomycetaceae bacterium]|nr:DUF1549 and DUF1553 domain-containing protein [Planctomycetaceae bacterium]
MPRTWLITFGAYALLCIANLAARAQESSLGQTVALKILPESPTATTRYPAQLSVLAIQPDGSAIDLTSDPKLSIELQSSETAQLENGRVVAIKPGSTTIIARYPLDKGELSAQAPLEVASDPPVAFDREVISTLTRSGCNLGTCHGNLHGKGGFRLSLRGDDTHFDYYRLAVEFSQRRIDLFDPGKSLLLLKATAQQSHQGGKRFANDSFEYQAIKSWIEQGAPESSASTLIAIEVLPAYQRIAPGNRSARVIVQARYADGSIRDVTRWSRLEPSLPSGLEVSQDGIVQTQHAMDVSIGATYLNGRAASRIVFLGQSDPTPREPNGRDSQIANNTIDRTIAKQCDQLRIELAGRADEGTFLRRLFLVTIGRLPSPEETLAYIQDTSPMRTEHRIDQLLADPGFDYVFLGVRIGCAKCHNHPFDRWKQDDYYGLAAHFTTLDRKQIDNKPSDALDKHVITGDEIISLSDKKPQINHPGRSKMVGPAGLQFLATPSDASPPADPSRSVLQDLATWLTENNPNFDANLANRIWYQYFGRGIVDPPDDFRESNPPSNPELLAQIASDFRADGYSLKKLSRNILSSSAFARSSQGDLADENILPTAPYFASYPLRRLAAEPLMDAISEVTGVTSPMKTGDSENTTVYSAMRMPGIPKKPGFLTTFGKPNRLLVCECERSNQISLGQSLAMTNGVEIRDKIASGSNRISGYLEQLQAHKAGDNSAMSPEKIIEELFLRALCRKPSARELQSTLEVLGSAQDPRIALEDILWALLNSKEFMMLR